MSIKLFKAYLSLFFLVTMVTPPSFSQNRQGNIVEYFGKEKVEEVSEGEPIHVFRKGLILKKKAAIFGFESVQNDPLFARILLSEKSGITPGGTENISKQILEWTPIEAGEKNEFTDPSLRTGYLYLEYDSPGETTLLLEASGHTNILINGFPHEGDHYDFGWQLIPVQMKKGKNEFILSGGRFPRMRARLINPEHAVQFTNRDLTLPDLLKEESTPLWGAIRVMNLDKQDFEGGSILCKIGGTDIKTPIPTISPMNIRKVPFRIPVPETLGDQDKIEAMLTLMNQRGEVLHNEMVLLNIKSKYKHHKRTFISNIDGSVQYYSIAPSSNKDLENPAMFLSVHGASVEAVNQARAYKQKDWGHLVAPTNRRPFGFAWEDWGRLDALEVLAHSEKILATDPQRTYLTGHSMGGHGTWYLGATYPDRFAAIAPCAGYPDLLGYRHSFIKRMMAMPESEISQFGFSKKELTAMIEASQLTDEEDLRMDAMIRRAGTPSRTKKLTRNYLHYGVYVLHGEDDTVVPTFIARKMREELGKFHNDFTYYEYPDGTHWYGDHSMDWPPIFDFFKARSIKPDSLIKEIEFSTGSPGVSEKSHFISILQQQKPFEISSFTFERKDTAIQLYTKNVATLAIDLDAMAPKGNKIQLDEQELTLLENTGKVYFAFQNGLWVKRTPLSPNEKGPYRSGGFKDAFRHQFVLVYATKGNKEENEWYYNRARQDAEKFWYRANGNAEVIQDKNFAPEKYADRNIILYGNKDNNSAWEKLLSHCPIEVTTDRFTIGDKTLQGNQWGAYFTYPRPDSEFASIGVITATGVKGMKGAYANDYLVNGTTFPDLLLFDHTMMSVGLKGLKCSGFFGNDWSVERGDFVWR